MRFMVSRTSLWGEEQPPCKEAFRSGYTHIDIRTTNDPKRVPAFNGLDDWWYSEGTNHRIINNRIARDFEREAWFVEIESLEQLLKFHERYGDLVLKSAFENYTMTEIEIYDGYRE